MPNNKTSNVKGTKDAQKAYYERQEIKAQKAKIRRAARHSKAHPNDKK